MIPTKLNPLGVNPYDGVMEFEKAGNLINVLDNTCTLDDTIVLREWGKFPYETAEYTLSCIIDATAYTAGELRLQIIVYAEDSVTMETAQAYSLYLPVTKVAQIYVKCNITEGRRVILRISRSIDTAQGVTIAYSNTMFCKGTNTTYEPYNNLYRCYGESTQYQNSGVNLLNLPDYETTYGGVTFTISNGKITTKGAGVGGAVFKLTNGYKTSWTASEWQGEYFLPAGTYTLSMQNKNGTGDGYYPTIIAITQSGQKCEVNWYDTTTRSKTITANEPIACIYCVVGQGKTIDCEFNIQFENGSTMTAWQSYVGGVPMPSPENPSSIVSKYKKGRYKTNLPGITIKLDDDLRSVPCGVADYVEVDVVTKEKYISRQIFRTMLNEDVSFYSNAEYGDTSRHITHKRLGTTQNAYGNDYNINTLCTHLKARASSTVGDVVGMWTGRRDPTFTGQAARGEALMFKDPSFVDDDAFRAFLRKGVEVCFALAEPTITQL